MAFNTMKHAFTWKYQWFSIVSAKTDKLKKSFGFGNRFFFLLNTLLRNGVQTL